MDNKTNLLKTAEWVRSKRTAGDSCPIFRCEFRCDKEVRHAELTITAMGVYEAILNDRRVGDFIMAPGWTAYDKRHQYQIYDITALIEKDNTLYVTVGKGWYRGMLTESRDKDVWGGFSAVIGGIEIVYTDSTKQEIVSDGKWMSTESQIKFSEIYDGETFDASYIPNDWGYSYFLHAPKTNLIMQEGEIVREKECVLPKKMFTTPRGETVIDFGQNMTGYVGFEIDAKAGEKLEYIHAETLDSDGNFYTANLRSAKQKISYTCKNGRQKYKPHHTFMGFRYIKILEAPNGIKMENFKAYKIYSDMERTGKFNCSNEKVNKLYSNIINGQTCNFLDIPTDCPQRDERLGWTGDAQVFVKTASYNFNVCKFFEKWLKDLAAEQMPDGRVHHVVPSVFECTNSSAAWGDASVICPWQIYLCYGKKEVLENQLDSMIAWVEYMHGQGDEEFLWIGGTHFGDWLGMDAGSGSYEGVSDKDLIASAYFAYSTGILAKALKVLGRENTKYEKMYNNIVKKFRERFSVYKTQTECALVLAFDIAEKPEKVAKQLAELVKANNNKITTGFVGTPYIMEALSENGYADVAYSLLLQEEYPSWLFSVNRGATTIWEHWDSMKEDGSMWDASMNSFNHYAYGAVGAWMYETILGIRIDENKSGFENVILQPIPDRRLEYAEGSVKTKFGTVCSSWRIKDDKITYEFDVPNTATLYLDNEVIELKKGKYSFERGNKLR